MGRSYSCQESRFKTNKPGGLKTQNTQASLCYNFFMLLLLGWVGYFLLLIIAASWTRCIYLYSKSKKPVTKTIILQTISFWIILIFFTLTKFNKIHILWIAPLVFLIDVVVSNCLFSGLSVKYSFLGLWKAFSVIIKKDKKEVKELEDLEKYLQSDKK